MDDVAAPILRRHGLSATFYIASDFLDGGLMFNDQVVEAVRIGTPHALIIAVGYTTVLDVMPDAARSMRRRSASERRMSGSSNSGVTSTRSPSMAAV